MDLRTFPILVALVAGFGGPVLTLSPLRPDTLSGWTRYVAATEGRINRELASTNGFLAEDFELDAAADRQALRAGIIVTRHLESRDASGGAIDVPAGLVHHWRGGILIPRMRLADVLANLQSDVPQTGQEDVLQSAVLEREPDMMRVFLKLRRTKFVTVVYNTEHVVRFRHYGQTRASSTSTATRIVELTDAGTAREREVAPGQDRGFLWRWNAYWRYEEVTGGVIVECESVSLSRGVPPVLRYLVGPLIESTARESMARTLVSMRAHFMTGAPALAETPPSSSLAR